MIEKRVFVRKYAGHASRWIAVLLFALMVLLLIAGCDGESEKAGGQNDGSGSSGASALVLPEFQVTTLEGNQVSSESLKGKVVLINFWATWCDPCVKEIPDLQRFYENWKDRGFRIVGFAEENPSGKGNRSDVKSFANQYGVTYPLAMSNRKIRDAFWSRFGYRQKLPTTFLINRDGRLVETFVGRLKPEQFREEVRPLLTN